MNKDYILVGLIAGMLLLADPVYGANSTPVDPFNPGVAVNPVESSNDHVKKKVKKTERVTVEPKPEKKEKKQKKQTEKSEPKKIKKKVVTESFDEDFFGRNSMLNSDPGIMPDSPEEIIRTEYSLIISALSGRVLFGNSEKVL